LATPSRSENHSAQTATATSGLGATWEPSGPFPRWGRRLVWVTAALVAATLSLSLSLWLRSEHQLGDPKATAATLTPERPPSDGAGVSGVELGTESQAGREAPPVTDPVEPAALKVTEGELRPGETLARALGRRGVSAAVVNQIDRELRPLFDFRRAKPGHQYQIRLAEDGELYEFVYVVSPLERYRLEPDGDRFRAWREEVPLERRRTRMAGVVTSSLYEAVEDLGEESQVASDFASIFAWDLDFSRTVHEGDQFRMLYERNYVVDDGEERYLGPGRILAASYAGNEGQHQAIYYELEKGRGGYFRPDGRSVQRKFLVAPLNFSRISSRFSHARFHPILKISRPHPGIDYAAPLGTPVWSVADGTVIFKGYAGDSGRLVKVRHRNGYVSFYAHLSRYASGLHVGEPVRQKQVIGFVGQSGLATGPHVCFRVTKDGHYMNPASINAPTADPVPPSHWLEFAAVRDARLQELGPISLVATDEAL